MSLAKFASLDQQTQRSIQSACEFVNHKIDEQRRRVMSIAMICVVAALLVTALSGVDFRVPGGIALLIVVIAAEYARRDIRKWYKTLVINRVVTALGNGLTYSRESGLTRDQFKSMDLFTESLDVFKSEDQISGLCKNVHYTLHEVRAARREQDGDHSREVVFFKGLVIMLEFNKNFQGHTIVVPDGQGLMGGLFGESKSRKDMQRITLPDAEFEDVYTAYSTDDQQGNYVLTPKLMQLVLKARNSLGVDLRLAFLANNLFVTVPSDEDRFEVSFFASRVSPADVIGDLAEVVQLAEQLIDVLDLETRIWTRV